MGFEKDQRPADIVVGPDDLEVTSTGNFGAAVLTTIAAAAEAARVHPDEPEQPSYTPSPE